MLIPELIDKFIDYLRSNRGYSEHTIRNYQIDLRQFQEFLTGGEGSGEKALAAQEPASVDFRVIREYLGSRFQSYPGVPRAPTWRLQKNDDRPQAIYHPVIFLFPRKEGAEKGQSSGRHPYTEIGEVYSRISPCG